MLLITVLSIIPVISAQNGIDWYLFGEWIDSKLTAQVAKNGENDAPKLSANDQFYECCFHDPNIPESCYKQCNYDQINATTVYSMALGSSPCPRTAFTGMFKCAGHYEDLGSCCESNNPELKGTACLEICDARPESKLVVRGELLPCIRHLDTILQCFKDNPVDDYY